MTLFGLFASHSVELQNDLLSYFADFLPPTAFQLVRSVATEVVAHASNRKMIFGVVSALWCVSNSVSSMISFLNAAHRVRETRSWCKFHEIVLGLSLLISILLLTTLFMVLAGGYFVGWLRQTFQLYPSVALVWKVIHWPVAIFSIALSCSLIYYYGPDLKEHRHWHWFTPGAAFGACVWLGTSFGFRIYLHFFNNYSVSYGSVGAVMILLVWLYATGLACLIGAEINAAIERASRQEGRSKTVGCKPSPGFG